MRDFADILPPAVAREHAGYARKMRVYVAKKSGATFSEIGRHMGITLWRVGQLYHRAVWLLDPIKEEWVSEIGDWKVTHLPPKKPPLERYLTETAYSTDSERKKLRKYIQEFRDKVEGKDRDWLIMSSDISRKTHELKVRWYDPL